MRRYYWDFFGPMAEGTARHFQHHLEEFFAREKMEGCNSGVDVAPGQVSAWVDAPEPHRQVIERALRPRRYAEG